ncbi:MAG: hypothetical protein U1F50_03380 [Rubrivivax sp.]
MRAFRVLRALIVPLALAAGAAQAITADEIVERNAAARGGVEAWKRVQTMAWAGRADNGAAPGRTLPFLLEQKRPGKTRFEVIAEGQRSVRLFDGREGWKLRQNPSTGRPESEAYGEDELRFAAGAAVIDGPLMDYAARHAVFKLAGADEVNGRRAWVLDVLLPTGSGTRVWVDAETFLELRLDRPLQSGGKPGVVTVFYADYRAFEGLQVPTVVETRAGPGRPANRLLVDRVALNPEIDDEQFARPTVQHVTRRKSITVDTRSAAAAAPAPR